MEPEHSTSSTTRHNKASKPQILKDTHETKDFEKESYKYEMMNYAKKIKHQLVAKLEGNSLKDKPIDDHQHVRKWVSPKIINGKSLLKWLIIVLNVIIELFQAVLAQEAGEGVINKANYVKLCVISSSLCLIMSIFDIIMEAKEGEVKWRKRGICVWLYYPGKHKKMFGSFWVVFGLISSSVQFLINLGSYVIKKQGFVKFDYLPLLLSVGFFVAAFVNGKKSMLGVVKCDEKHGEYGIEGRFVHGSWVFECPSCKMESSV